MSTQPLRHPAAASLLRRGAVMAAALLALAPGLVAASQAAASVAATATAVGLDPASGELRIDARRASRSQLARQLAALTGSELRVADEALLDQGGPLTMRWQGRDAIEAWQLLLGAAASHALQCQGLRCRVWLLGGLAPSAGSPASAASAPRAAPLRVASSAPAQQLQAAQQRPQAMQPDPPGLFPSE